MISVYLKSRLSLIVPVKTEESSLFHKWHVTFSRVLCRVLRAPVTNDLRCLLDTDKCVLGTEHCLLFEVGAQCCIYFLFCLAAVYVFVFLVTYFLFYLISLFLFMMSWALNCS